MAALAAAAAASKSVRDLDRRSSDGVSPSSGASWPRSVDGLKLCHNKKQTSREGRGEEGGGKESARSKVGERRQVSKTVSCMYIYSYVSSRGWECVCLPVVVVRRRRRRRPARPCSPSSSDPSSSPCRPTPIHTGTQAQKQKLEDRGRGHANGCSYSGMAGRWIGLQHCVVRVSSIRHVNGLW